jgi:hypothetical protein
MPYNSGSIANFSASAISDTYQRVVQTDGVYLADGTGSILQILNVTASYALNSATTGGSGSAFPYTGSAEITGSLTVTGSVSATLFVGTINGGTF